MSSSPHVRKLSSLRDEIVYSQNRVHAFMNGSDGDPDKTAYELDRCLEDFDRFKHQVEVITGEVSQKEQAEQAYTNGFVDLMVNRLLSCDDETQKKALENMHVLGSVGQQIAATLVGRGNARAASATPASPA